MKHIKRFREEGLKVNNNNKIDIIKNNFKFISSFDIRQRGDDKWGSDIIRTDENGKEEVVFTGWYPYEYLSNNQTDKDNEIVFPGMERKSLDISIRTLFLNLHLSNAIESVFMFSNPVKVFILIYLNLIQSISNLISNKFFGNSVVSTIISSIFAFGDTFIFDQS